ncbi:MAG: EAL domain-containing protein [Parasphingorhabdus sp.]
MVNAIFTLLDYPKFMYAFLQRRIFASLLLVALALGSWYASQNRWLEDYELLAQTQLSKFRSTEVSQDIVVVGLDDKSYRANPQWPWPRSDHAQIVDHLNDYGVERIFFDIYFPKPSIESEDAELSRAFSQSTASIFLPAIIDENEDGSLYKTEQYERFVKHAKEVDIGLLVSSQRQVVAAPYRVKIDGKEYSSFASEITGRVGPFEEWFPLDYAYDWKSVPTYSAIDILTGNVKPEKLKGKTVLYGYYSLDFGDVFSDPTGQDIPGMAAHAIGANVLLNGIPSIVEKWVPILIGSFLCLICIWFLKSRTALAFALVLIPLILFVSIMLRVQSVYIEILPTLSILIASCIYFRATAYQNQIDAGRRVHRESGLPNLQAFCEDQKNSHKSAVISINFDGYDLVRRSLSNSQLQTLLDQIRTRLSIISNEIYQGTDGSLYFVIETLDEKDIIESLQGLKMFFVNPIALDGHMIALKPAFGYDIEPTEELSVRAGHALVASCQAQITSQKIIRFDSMLLDEEKKHLSMQSTIKRAMDQRELEIYIQPQIDIASGWTVSGEALVRWNDPLRGLISPGEFMPILEKTPLIASLTLHILKLAISALNDILPLADDFKVSVNVPPSLMTDSEFTDQALELIEQSEIPNSAVILEITERGMLFDKDIAKQEMQRFVDAGIEFSIDDFGTANSNIEILRSIPASELKIDQSFINGLTHSTKDQALVESIINMAHGLKYIVVAEGVEDQQILNLLTILNCDKVQGYHLSKPLKVSDFTGHLIREFLHKRVLDRSKYG